MQLQNVGILIALVEGSDRKGNFWEEDCLVLYIDWLLHT